MDAHMHTFSHHTPPPRDVPFSQGSIPAAEIPGSVHGCGLMPTSLLGIMEEHHRFAHCVPAPSPVTATLKALSSCAHFPGQETPWVLGKRQGEL